MTSTATTRARILQQAVATAMAQPNKRTIKLCEAMDMLAAVDGKRNRHVGSHQGAEHDAKTIVDGATFVRLAAALEQALEDHDVAVATGLKANENRAMRFSTALAHLYEESPRGLDFWQTTSFDGWNARSVAPTDVEAGLEAATTLKGEMAAHPQMLALRACETTDVRREALHAYFDALRLRDARQARRNAAYARDMLSPKQGRMARFAPFMYVAPPWHAGHDYMCIVTSTKHDHPSAFPSLEAALDAIWNGLAFQASTRTHQIGMTQYIPDPESEQILVLGVLQTPSGPVEEIVWHCTGDHIAPPPGLAQGKLNGHGDALIDMAKSVRGKRGTAPSASARLEAAGFAIATISTDHGSESTTATVMMPNDPIVARRLPGTEDMDRLPSEHWVTQGLTRDLNDALEEVLEEYRGAQYMVRSTRETDGEFQVQVHLLATLTDFLEWQHAFHYDEEPTRTPWQLVRIAGNQILAEGVQEAEDVQE